MKTKEISVHVAIGGVIATANYENLRVDYRNTGTYELEGAELKKEDEIRQNIMKQFEKDGMKRMEFMQNKCKADYIKSKIAGFRFYEHEGLQLPSVTSIFGYDADFGNMSEVDLAQHGAMGCLREIICMHFMRHKEWLDTEADILKHYPEESEHISIISAPNGLHLPIFSDSYKILLDKHAKDIEIIEDNVPVYNTEDMYAGRPDIYGKFKGEPAILDWKKGGFKWEQLAAYAKAKLLNGEPVEKLVILPIGDNDNVSGYEKPKVNDRINYYYQSFMRKRRKVKEMFGV